jgi:hypothetical protein
LLPVDLFCTRAGALISEETVAQDRRPRKSSSEISEKAGRYSISIGTSKSPADRRAPFNCAHVQRFLTGENPGITFPIENEK